LIQDIFFDYFIKIRDKEVRHRLARDFISYISEPEFTIYEPFLFDIELMAVLVRKMNPQKVMRLVNEVISYVNIIEEPVIHSLAAKIALDTGCRAIDAYYIATAIYSNAILVTNDKTMKNNAAKVGIETYYLLEEHNLLIEKIKR